MNCSCKTCRKACKTIPGLFSFEQIKKVAHSLHLSSTEFSKYLVFELALVEDPVKETVERFLIAAPRRVDEIPGTIRKPLHTGVCIFFKNGLCSIHDNKPEQCQRVDHTTTVTEHRVIKHSIGSTWRIHGRIEN